MRLLNFKRGIMIPLLVATYKYKSSPTRTLNKQAIVLSNEKKKCTIRTRSRVQLLLLPPSLPSLFLMGVLELIHLPRLPQSLTDFVILWGTHT